MKLTDKTCSCINCIEKARSLKDTPLMQHAYTAYIASDQWRSSEARMAELEAAGNRCRACDRGPPEVRLEVHHRTYVRLGCELARDLTTFCAECHLAITDDQRRRRHAATTLPVLLDSWSCLPARRLLLSDWIDARFD